MITHRFYVIAIDYNIEREYATIIQVAEKIPAKLLQEYQKLLMWYSQTITRTGGE